MTPPRSNLWPHADRGTCVPTCELYGRCHCGCNEVTRVCTNSYVVRGNVRGHYQMWRPGHSVHSNAAWHSLAGNGYNFHRDNVPLERVRPLLDFLARRYGSLNAAAPHVGVSVTTLCAVRQGSKGKKSVRPEVARKIVDAVLAHRPITKPAERDPLVTFDIETPRAPTQWERDRAELYASAEYRKLRESQRYALVAQEGITALDQKVKNRVYRKALREQRRGPWKPWKDYIRDERSLLMREAA